MLGGRGKLQNSDKSFALKTTDRMYAQLKIQSIYDY